MLAVIERDAHAVRRTRVVMIGLVAAVLVGVFALAGASQAAAKGTVWLCLPGHSPDPCTPGLSTTAFSPKLKKLGVSHPKQVKKPAFDCFYVYPTVSDQKTQVANLHIDPAEKSIALYQAARYSQYCRVFAPMYRQTTLVGIGQATGSGGSGPTPAQAAEGPADVTKAFLTYLKKFNDGRGFVLIGHSQGSFVLRQLIAKQVDTKPAVRKRLISAILMGGNVLVKQGSDVGGDFKHIRACHSDTQIGCVIAFSTFDQTPPADSLFGRTGGTVGGGTSSDQILCTNPAALGGGSGKLDPIFPSKPFAPGTIATGNSLLMITQPMPKTTWASIPGSYSAQCSAAGGAHVLEIKPLGGAQTPHPAPTPEWGLHLLDANIALGNLVSDVKSEAAAFAKNRK
jgi:hypothetical protein